ncbi:late embryogenesis abundant protein At1g64065-like [Pyrus communis]|uniref:late embryogenesis abundant protein At1g64065-like n=1 Tax=Pyrus communis TaxID=23211 RepID=UPI0035C06CEB
MTWKNSDAESLQSVDELKRRKRIKLTMYIVIFIVSQIIVITMMSLTMMKVKTPKVRLGNISVQDLNSIQATPSFNTKFKTQIRVKNTNFGPYEFDAGIVTFLYQSVIVEQVAIPKSKARMLSTKKFDVEVSLSSSALRSSNLGGELSNGVLTLNSRAKLTGKVELMFIMKKKKSSTMDFTIAFDLSSKTLKSLQCK